MLDSAEDAWGADLLAYLLGAGIGVGSLAGWRPESAIREVATLTRLKFAVAVQRLFEGSSAARAWVRNLHPELGYRSPATVIRAGTDDDRRAALELAERESQKLRAS